MTSIGPFTITGDPTDDHLAEVRHILSLDFPWHVLCTRDFGIYFDIDATYQTGGILRGTTINIWGPYQPPHHHRSIRWALAHEIGHCVDSVIFRQQPSIRNSLHAIFHNFAPGHDHLRQTRDLPKSPGPSHDPHGWSNSGRTPHDRAGGEAFAEWFASFLGTHSRTSYGGHHNWKSSAQQTAIEEIVMSAVEDIDLYTDVPKGHTHRDGIHWAAGQGLVQGFPDGTFRPDEPVSRAQLCTVLHNQERS